MEILTFVFWILSGSFAVGWFCEHSLHKGTKAQLALREQGLEFLRQSEATPLEGEPDWDDEETFKEFMSKRSSY